MEYAPIYEVDGFVCRKDIISDDIYNALVSDTSGTAMQMISLIAQQK